MKTQSKLPALWELIKRVNKDRSFLAKSGRYPLLRHPIRTLCTDWHEISGCEVAKCGVVQDRNNDQTATQKDPDRDLAENGGIALVLALLLSGRVVTHNPSLFFPHGVAIAAVGSLITLMCGLVSTNRANWRRHQSLLAVRRKHLEQSGRGMLLTAHILPILAEAHEAWIGSRGELTELHEQLGKRKRICNELPTQVRGQLAQHLRAARLKPSVQTPISDGLKRVQTSYEALVRDMCHLQTLATKLGDQLDLMDHLAREQPDNHSVQRTCLETMNKTYEALTDALAHFVRDADTARIAARQALHASDVAEANEIKTLMELGVAHEPANDKDAARPAA